MYSKSTSLVLYSQHKSLFVSSIFENDFKTLWRTLCSYLAWPHFCKFFTYVTKTCANLTTYSRKPENYNGTIIFEIDIMKKSSPINLNLCQTWLFHKFFGCFFCFDLLWSWAESAVSPAEKKCYFGFGMAKSVNFKLSEDEFFMMSIPKIMVPL